MLLRLSVTINQKLLLHSNTISQRIAKCKFSRIAYNTINVLPRNSCAFNIHKHSNVTGIFSIRHQSTVGASTANETISDTLKDPSAQIQEAVKGTHNAVTETAVASDISDIPDIPTPPSQEIIENVIKFHPNGEPTFASIGLGGYYPTGLFQTCLESLHFTYSLPWWVTIVASTFVLKMLVFPIVIATRKCAVHMYNNGPEMQKLQLKMTEARQSGNQYEAAICAQDLMQFMKEKQLNPIKSMLLGLAQAPVFLTCFLGLRKMAEVPVESLRTGGIWWFTDLTVPDPYYLLPIITCVTMYVTIEVSLIGSTTSGLGRYFMKCIPVIMFPFIQSFPSALLCYWVTSNFISLFQTALLKPRIMSDFFKIPPMVNHEKKAATDKSKGTKGSLADFKQGVKDSWKNVKISKRLSEKQHADSIQFNTAGRGPLKKTYKYDPTKNPPTAASILTKKR